MTLRMMVTCDSSWDGFPCRGAYPAGSVGNVYAARREAEAKGWSFSASKGDLCPAHTGAYKGEAIFNG